MTSAINRMARLTASFARSSVGKALAGSFAVAIAARIALLIMAVVLARDLGPKGYGIFVFATGAAALLAQMTALGWPSLMNRLIPKYWEDGHWPLLGGFLRAGTVVVVITSVLASVILVVVGLYANLASRDIATGLLLSVLLIVPFALTKLRRQQLSAVGKPAAGIFYDEALGPIILVIAFLGAGTLDLASTMMIYGAASVLAVVLGTLVFRRLLPAEIAGVRPTYLFAGWMGMALPMIVGLSSKLLMNKTDVLLLAPLAGVEQVGLYGAAFRVTYFISFPQLVLMTVMTPLISQAFASRRPDQLRARLRAANIFSLLTAVPPTVVIILFREEIMTGVFGPAFTAAAGTLAILTFGQMAASLAMPFSSLLMMGGRERMFGFVNFVTLILNVLLNLWLAPRYGAEGSAIATAVCVNLILVLQILLSVRLLRDFQNSVDG